MKKLGCLFVGVVLIMAFQNCEQASDIEFSSNVVEPTVAQMPVVVTPPTPPVVDPPAPPPTPPVINCLSFENRPAETTCSETYGLLGKLYYLLDKTDGRLEPASVFDKNDVEIKVNEGGLTSVNDIIDRGLASDNYLHLRDVFVPSMPFSTGFRLADDELLLNTLKQPVKEFFALDLKANLTLSDEQTPGYYAMAVLSDDGSILDVDSNGDGEMEELVNNDGFHAPRLACSEQLVYLDHNSKMPMRLRYFQGPRVIMAMVLMMKKVNNPSTYVQDSQCGVAEQWNGGFYFGMSPSRSNYVPDFINSPFGQLMNRGWFVPNQEMFLLPEIK